MKIRCKFRLSEIRIHHETYRTYIFRAEYDPSIPEDSVFQKMSPTGEFTICVTNPVVFEEWKINSYYYLDATPVPVAADAAA